MMALAVIDVDRRERRRRRLRCAAATARPSHVSRGLDLSLRRRPLRGETVVTVRVFFQRSNMICWIERPRSARTGLMNSARGDAVFDRFSTYFEMTNKTFATSFPCALVSAAGIWYLHTPLFLSRLCCLLLQSSWLRKSMKFGIVGVRAE